MKLKTIRPHYYNNEYMHKGTVYMADKVHSEVVTRRGICEEVKETKELKTKKK